MWSLGYIVGSQSVWLPVTDISLSPLAQTLGNCNYDKSKAILTATSCISFEQNNDTQ